MADRRLDPGHVGRKKADGRKEDGVSAFTKKGDKKRKE